MTTPLEAFSDWSENIELGAYYLDLHEELIWPPGGTRLSTYQLGYYVEAFLKCVRKCLPDLHGHYNLFLCYSLPHSGCYTATLTQQSIVTIVDRDNRIPIVELEELNKYYIYHDFADSISLLENQDWLLYYATWPSPTNNDNEPVKVAVMDGPAAEVVEKIKSHPEQFQRRTNGPNWFQYCVYGLKLASYSESILSPEAKQVMKELFRLHILAWNGRLTGVHLLRQHFQPASPGSETSDTKLIGEALSVDRATCVVFFSVSGAVGKSHLALSLARELTSLARISPCAKAPILVDADLIGANVTKALDISGCDWFKTFYQLISALRTHENLSAKELLSDTALGLKGCLSTLRDHGKYDHRARRFAWLLNAWVVASREGQNALEQRQGLLDDIWEAPLSVLVERPALDGSHITAFHLADRELSQSFLESLRPPKSEKTVEKTGAWIRAAEWVTEFSAWRRKKDSCRIYESAPVTEERVLDLIAYATDIARSEEQWKTLVEEAARMQALLGSDSQFIVRFWTNIFRLTASSRAPVIVDLPAGGPTGLVVSRQWFAIQEQALNNAVLWRNHAGSTIRIVRVFVTTDSEHDHGAAAYVRQNLGPSDVVVWNMSPPPRSPDQSPKVQSQSRSDGPSEVTVPIARQTYVKSALAEILDLAPNPPSSADAYPDRNSILALMKAVFPS